MINNGEIGLCGLQLHKTRREAFELADLHGESSHLQFIEITVEV